MVRMFAMMTLAVGAAATCDKSQCSTDGRYASMLSDNRKGKKCLARSSWVHSGCDGDETLESRCENYGNPTCCTDPFYGGEVFKCADKFDKLESKDFEGEECKELCLNAKAGIVKDGTCSVFEQGKLMGKVNCTMTGDKPTPNFRYGNLAYGKMCQRKKTRGNTIAQGCDGGKNEDHCEDNGNAPTCCTAKEWRAKIVCSEKGFATKPEEKHFEQCETKCSTQVPCDSSTCSIDGATNAVLKDNKKGKKCLAKLKGENLQVGCDGDKRLDSKCENFGNPSCCFEPSGAFGEEKIYYRCADKFEKGVQAKDFKDDPKCNELCLNIKKGLVKDGKCLVVNKGVIQGTANCATTGPKFDANDPFPNQAYGEKCSREEKMSYIFQGCDGQEKEQKSLCQKYGNPSTCCTRGATKYKLICSDTGFTEKPEKKDFEKCEAECTEGGSNSASSGSSSTKKTSSGSSSTKKTYKLTATVTVKDCPAAKNIVSAGKAAFKDALTKSMLGITVTDTQLATVNCPTRRLEDIRSLTAAKPGVKADYTYTASAPGTKPANTVFKTNVNAALTSNGVTAAVESVTLSDPEIQQAVSTAVCTKLGSLLVAVCLLGISG